MSIGYEPNLYTDGNKATTYMQVAVMGPTHFLCDCLLNLCRSSCCLQSSYLQNHPALELWQLLAEFTGLQATHLLSIHDIKFQSPLYVLWHWDIAVAASLYCTYSATKQLGSAGIGPMGADITPPAQRNSTSHFNHVCIFEQGLS